MGAGAKQRNLCEAANAFVEGQTLIVSTFTGSKTRKGDFHAQDCKPGSASCICCKRSTPSTSTCACHELQFPGTWPAPFSIKHAASMERGASELATCSSHI